MELSLTLIITGITVIVSLWAFSRPEKVQDMLMNPYLVTHQRQYHRLLLHGFIHADYIHLFFNMFVFYQFGEVVEQVFTNQQAFNTVIGPEHWWGPLTGKFLFVFLYVGAILAATIPSMLKHRNNPSYQSLGASGAVSAILIVFILMFPMAQLALFFIIPMPAFVAGILFFVYESYMNKRGRTGVAHDAHLYGALFGIVLMTLLVPGIWWRFITELPFVNP